ncbi:hypothetical protein K431DRAFT_303428 [Polychaeton citri CBS 116435]|uniref:C2H2-type domain-containing protein n=1 Tax=Polychaeton citri CBS 116435 TaxID=1314669 RepID=A0A9P4Q6D9_9PEZI|nr:hypothetical protein K431DRAFT_303428 [Polychaeton citri CBS 116435]
MSSTPSIRISQHLRHPSSHPSYNPLHAASPMAIPNIQEAVPPPLPPPTFIPDLGTGHDPGWQWGNDPNSIDFGRAASVRPGSSLLGNAAKGPMRGREARSTQDNGGAAFARTVPSISTIIPPSYDHDMTDDNSDGDASASSAPKGDHRLQGTMQLEQRILEDSSQAYDKRLLSRIGGPNTPKRQSISFPSGTSLESSQQSQPDGERRDAHLRPLSMPERHGSFDSPGGSRWPPSSDAGFVEHGPPDHHHHHHHRPQTRRGSIQHEDTQSHRGSYDHSIFLQDDFPMEDAHPKQHERSPGFDDAAKAGLKRRASSPPRDVPREDRMSIASTTSQADLHRRPPHGSFSRGSPVSRFFTNHSVASPASSYGPRHNSLGSSFGLLSNASSVTSFGSGRVSPNALSPAVDSDLRPSIVYNAAKAANPPVIPYTPQHQHTSSSSSSSLGSQSVMRKMPTDSIMHSRNSSLSAGLYICECCPKKPKKFDTEDELKLHESEKQYTCAYCSNRFKNKNEAERHQNSLHLRRHSWSCAALSSVEAAFQPAPSGNGTDACGYCGEEFPSPASWAARHDHLNHVHKFGECNQTKKFYRADHFRQHLKHSHSGTSGKWTNTLETACMKIEPPPEKRVNHGAPIPHTAPTLIVPPTGLSCIQGNPGVIPETPHDT